MRLTDIMEQWRAMRARQTTASTARARHIMHETYLASHPIAQLNAATITPKQILDLIDVIANNSNSQYMSRRVLSDIVNAYDYAAVLGQVEHNPAARLVKYLPPCPRQHRAFLPPREFATLLRSIDARPQISRSVKNAFYAIVLTAQRRSEIVLATWDEIDFHRRIWTIPGERMKMREPHIITISAALLPILYEQQLFDSRWVFPSPHKSYDCHVALSSPNHVIRRSGYRKNTQSIHGIRHLFSTYANDSGLWSAKAIERQLDHRPRGVAGVYDKSTMMDERRRLMEWWGEQIQTWRGLY